MIFILKIKHAISNLSDFKVTYNLYEPKIFKKLNLGIRRVLGIPYKLITIYMIFFFITILVLNIIGEIRDNILGNNGVETGVRMFLGVLVIGYGLICINIISTLLTNTVKWVAKGFNS